MEREALKAQRSVPVTKHNDIIQKAKYSLTAAEQRALAFIISKVRMDDKQLSTSVFPIRDYCMVCNIDPNDGHNREQIKKDIKRLGTAAFWFTNGSRESLRTWLDANSIHIDWDKGTVTAQLSGWLSEYLLGLKKNFTEYSLDSILPMQSEYSIRIFEICKSHLYQGGFEIQLEALKEQLVKEGQSVSEFYPRWPDFRRKVIEQAEKEINAFSEIFVEWEPVRLGNRTTGIRFKVSNNSNMSRYMNYWAWEDRKGVPGQMSLEDFLQPKEVDADR